MTERSDNRTAQFECPQCGEPVARIGTSESDATGAGRIEFQCVNGHRIVVELHETIVDSDFEA